jgi:MFS family permease
VSGALEPLRERNFRLLATARTVDYLGNGMAPIALSFAVLDLTGSVTDLGVVVGVRSLANVLLVLFGGVLADRFPRAAVLQGSAAVAAISQAVVAASVLGRFDSIGLLAALGAVNGAAAAASLPASVALTSQTVPANLLRQANALARIGQTGAQVIGASVGGVLVGSFGPGWALAIDSASFVVVAVCFTRLRLPAGARVRVRSSTLHELRVGWQAFVAQTWVWVIVLQFLVMNAISAGGVQVLGPSIAEHSIGRTEWGLVLAAQTLGGVVGGLVAANWLPRKAMFWGVALCMLEALPLLALGHLPVLAALLPAMFVIGFGLALFGVAWQIGLQENIPNDRLARVSSYDALGSFVAIPLGQVAVGPLSIAIGNTSTLDGGAALVVLVTLAALAVPSVRQLTVKSTERGKAAKEGEVSDRR